MRRAQPTPLRRGSKAHAVYERAHVAWRSGVISSWYFGRRSPSDPTVAWMVDGIEFDRKDLAGVQAALTAAFFGQDTADASLGAPWCGYRPLHVRFVDASQLVQRYDATRARVVREYTAASAARAVA